MVLPTTEGNEFPPEATHYIYGIVSYIRVGKTTKHYSINGYVPKVSYSKKNKQKTKL